jgi:hypothetical protein
MGEVTVLGGTGFQSRLYVARARWAQKPSGSASDDVIRTLKINEPRRRYMTRRWLPTQLFTTVG